MQHATDPITEKTCKNQQQKKLGCKCSEISIKKVLAAVDAKDAAAAAAAYNEASSKLDKAVAKGIHHKNYATRQKSRLAKAINAIAA